MDFGTLPDGKHSMVIIDDYSKYPEIEILSSLSAAEVIQKVEKVMATHGLLKEIRTDNGPPFQGQEFASYLASHGIVHRKITPKWPQANGEAKRFMKTLNKIIRISVAMGDPMEQSIYSFLRDYRQTPHVTTGVAPSHLSMGRVVDDSIPSHTSWAPSQVNDCAIEEKRRKVHAKASDARRAKTSDLKVGDLVLVQNRHSVNKFRLPFEKEPWRLTEIRGTRVSVVRGQEHLTGNMSAFKRYHGTLRDPDNREERDELDVEWDDDPLVGLPSPSPRATAGLAPDAPGRASEASEGCTEKSQGPDKAVSPRQIRGQHSQYRLRCNPAPSTRLRDFHV